MKAAAREVLSLYRSARTTGLWLSVPLGLVVLNAALGRYSWWGLIVVAATAVILILATGVRRIDLDQERLTVIPMLYPLRPARRYSLAALAGFERYRGRGLRIEVHEGDKRRGQLTLPAYFATAYLAPALSLPALAELIESHCAV